MSLLKDWWPLLVIAVLVIVVVRRVRGEPLDLKDAVVAPLVLLAIGTRTIIDVAPTPTDIFWLVALSVVGLGFGAARAATIVIERREGQLIQRYRWTTFALLVASLIAGGVLGLVAHRFGMHEAARPMTFTIGIGLAGEGLITLIRASRRGAVMPWTPIAEDVVERLRDRD